MLARSALRTASLLSPASAAARAAALVQATAPGFGAYASAAFRLHSRLARMPALARTTRLFASTPTALDKVSQSLPGVGLKASTDRMIIGFTCKVCGQRSHKSMSKKAYTSGVVIIKCDGCKNMHLIADHLGWFDSMNPPGTIEDILRAKGETVKRVEVPQPLRFKVAPSAAEASPDAAAALSQMGVDADGMLEWLPKAIADAEADMNLGKDKQ